MQSQPIVYIVDDDAPVRGALTLLMEAEGLQTRSYASAEEFLDNITPTSKGCVLLDVRMPGLSGLEVQQILKGKHVSMPVIIMTGYAEVPMAVQVIKAGSGLSAIV
jgi:two-component system response regulator FixJ